MRKGQTKRVWTKEQKLEIVHKHLDEHISIKKLGKEYGIIHGMVSRWIKEYLAGGEAAFDPKPRLAGYSLIIWPINAARKQASAPKHVNTDIKSKREKNISSMPMW